MRALASTGRPIRCLARRPEYLEARRPPTVEVVAGDVLEPSTLRDALRGIDTAYYLIHSMGSSSNFEAQDREAAENFARAAEEQGVRRIIYLGGLGTGDSLSEHLRSRHEVGRILRESGVPTVELRASIVIGSGSLSFEMIRALVERLPVMVTPRWVRIQAQPIAVEDLIELLIEALDIDALASAIYEVGGSDAVSYGEIMHEYARQRGLRRLMIPVPALTPHLSSLWLGLVTPIYARVGRKLVDGLRNATVVNDRAAERVFRCRPRGIADAISRALVNEDREFAETRWSDALSSPGPQRSLAGVRFGSRIVDSRAVETIHAPESAFAPIRRIGGRTGWYYGDRLWRLRGLIDLLLGGVGSRRGRRDPEQLAPGETVDFWRVEAVEPDRLLRLRAEMKLPGRAWLQFEVEPEPAGGSRVRQTAVFDPVGLFGLAYWYALYPLHQLVFKGMLERIVEKIDDLDPVPSAR
ncbi:MAG: SDR family oxidoreductase [Gemmatimonadetes bacterium]|nr:SDR family oxidoreductase [Gemmatimonadota bacterium]